MAADGNESPEVLIDVLGSEETKSRIASAVAL
jgi:hypothetical protein